MLEQNCPDVDELKSFVRCEISEEQASQIGQHLEECPKCEETVVGIERGSDTVAEKIRQAAVQPSFADEAERQQLVSRMQDARAYEATQLSSGDSPATGTSVEIPDGQVLRDYKIVAKLGEGGMGAVYKAVHQRLKKPVALKVLPTKTIGDKTAVARFEREMEVLGQLNHPNIVQALDAGEHDGQHYLVMEYVEGSDLSGITRRCSPLSVADACLMISQAAAGLQYAHENGFVHRDIKPSNLMLARSGSAAGRSQAIIKILDLGLARALEQKPNAAGSAELTSAGQVMGTLDYMAPEQGGDSHQVDIRADIYSLGASLYKLLTGDSPFAEHAHKPIMQRLMAIAQHEPPPIRSKRADVPEKLAAVIHRMLAKKPEQRFATPADVEQALQPFCAGADLTSLLVPEGATRVLESPMRTAQSVPAAVLKSDAGRRTKTLIAGVAAVLLLAAVMVITTKHGKVEVTSPDGELPPDVKVSVSRNGDEVEVLQSDNHWSAKLVNGEYQVSLRRGDDKFELKDSKLTISRMGRARVELALKREAVASTTTPKTEPAAPAKVTTPPDTQKPSPPVVAKAVNDKPFSIERAGQKLKSYKSLGPAYEESQPGDILLLEGVAPIAIKFPKVTKPLHLKTVGEHRALLRLTNGTDGVPHSNYIDIDSELHFEGCDIDAGESTFVVRSQGSLVVRGSRIWGGVTDIGQATFSDSLLVAHSFSAGGLEAKPKPSELALDNCGIRHLGQAFVYVVHGRCDFKMNRCTFHSRAGAFIAVPEKSEILVEAHDNLFDSDRGIVVSPSSHGPWHSMEGYSRVNWVGSGNCFAGHWFTEYGLDENQQPVEKAKGLEAWNRLWKQPEVNSREIPAMALELAKGSRLSAPERTSYFGNMLDGLRRQHSLAEIGPDTSLIGPGDAYVRALAAAGHPVSDENLRPERPDEGPVLLLRNGKLIKAYGQLGMAMQDAMDGDVLELRTDGTVPGGLTVGTGRHLTIRSAPGYRPIIDGLGEHNDLLSLEGLLLQGGILSSGGYGTNDPAKPYASEGGFERIVNCSLVAPAENGHFIGGWLYPKNGQTPIIQNCDFGHIGFAVAPKTQATISNSIFSWMRLTTLGTPETTGSMTFDRCLAWFPYLEHGSRGNVLITHGPSQIQWNRTVLAAAVAPFSESAFANMGGFTGENNAFLISSNWRNHRLEAFRKELALPMNGVEFPPLEFDPTQWRICRELSPGYMSRPDGSDYGIDLDRLVKSIMSPQRREPAHVAKVEAAPVKRPEVIAAGDLPPVAPLPETILPDRQKPFVVLSPDGKALGDFKFVSEALAGWPGDLILEVHGNGPFKLPQIVREKCALTIKAAKGYRPRFETGFDMPVEGSYRWLDLQEVELTVTNCDFFARPKGNHPIFVGTGKQWTIRGCRLIQASNNSALLGFYGERLEIRDSFMANAAIDLRPTDELSLVNNIYYLSPAGSGAGQVSIHPNQNQRVQLSSSLFYGDFPLRFGPRATPTSRSEITASGNLFMPRHGAMVIGWQPNDLLPKEVFQWIGRGNRFAPFQTGPMWMEVADPKANKPPRTVEEWNTLWGNADDLTLVKDVRFEWDYLSLSGWTEGAKRFTKELELARANHPKLPNVGPDMTLVGAGDAYDRIRNGGELPAEDQRPEPLEGGPFVLIREGKPPRGYLTLANAIVDVQSGDEIEIRSDATFRKVHVALPDDKSLTLRAATGYRPVLTGAWFQTGDWSLEGLHLQQDGPDGFVLSGSVRRVANCTLAPSTVLCGLQLPAGLKQPLEIVNCYSSVQIRVVSHAEKHPFGIKLDNSVVPLVHASSSDAGTIEVSRCCFWTHTYPEVFVGIAINVDSAKPLQVKVADSLFDANMVVAASKLKWQGERNLYRLHSGDWGAFEPPSGTDMWRRSLDEWRAIWNSDTDSESDDSAVLRPELWRERKQ